MQYALQRLETRIPQHIKDIVICGRILIEIVKNTVKIIPIAIEIKSIII